MKIGKPQREFDEPAPLPKIEPQPAAAPATSDFGASCQTDANCSGAADYCAKMPGQSSGTCTVTGCKEQPSRCPSGYGCFDLSQFAAGLPSICTKS